MTRGIFGPGDDFLSKMVRILCFFRVFVELVRRVDF